MDEILLEELMDSTRWVKRSSIPTAPVSKVAAFRGSCSRLVCPRLRASDDSRRFTSTLTVMTVSGIRLVNWMSFAASRGSNSGNSKVSMLRMRMGG